MDKNQESILEAFRRGDSAAAQKVGEWAKAEVARLSKTKPSLRNPDCQEDRVQDALAKLLDRRPNDPEKTQEPRMRVRRVVERVCLDWLRSTRRERDLAEPSPAHEEGRERRRETGVEGLAETAQRLDGLQKIDHLGLEKTLEEDRERLIGHILEATLQYLDLAYRIRGTYQKDTKRYERTVLPLFEAKLKVIEARKSIFGLALSKEMPLRDEEKQRAFGPLLLAAQASLQTLNELIRTKTAGLAYMAEDPDWPLDFNEFIGPELVHMRLRPATLIFRVWSKIVKKKAGSRYADYDLMCQYYDELRCRHKGTDKEYLFQGTFNPEALRVEAFKASKMKPFYDRLAEWIYQKARVEKFTLDEALEEEDSHVPVYRNRGLLVLPLSK